jgi:hypothetical protein
MLQLTQTIEKCVRVVFYAKVPEFKGYATPKCTYAERDAYLKTLAASTAAAGGH